MSEIARALCSGRKLSDPERGQLFDFTNALTFDLYRLSAAQRDIIEVQIPLLEES